jgi:hypothetical protein
MASIPTCVRRLVTRCFWGGHRPARPPSREQLTVVCTGCGTTFVAAPVPDVEMLRAQETWDVVAWLDDQRQAARVRLTADCPHHRLRFAVDGLNWRRVMGAGVPGGSGRLT